MVCGVKKETSYLHGAQHYAVVTLHKNAGVSATTPFTYSKSSTSTESLRRRGKNQQQLIFPSVLSPATCFRFTPLSLPLPLPLAQEPEPSAPRKLRAPLAELSARVAVFVLFQVPKLVERSTRVEYFLHGVRLRQRGRV